MSASSDIVTFFCCIVRPSSSSAPCCVRPVDTRSCPFQSMIRILFQTAALHSGHLSANTAFQAVVSCCCRLGIYSSYRLRAITSFPLADPTGCSKITAQLLPTPPLLLHRIRSSSPVNRFVSPSNSPVRSSVPRSRRTLLRLLRASVIYTRKSLAILCLPQCVEMLSARFAYCGTSLQHYPASQLLASPSQLGCPCQRSFSRVALAYSTRFSLPSQSTTEPLVFLHHCVLLDAVCDPGRELSLVFVSCLPLLSALIATAFDPAHLTSISG